MTEQDKDLIIRVEGVEIVDVGIRPMMMQHGRTKGGGRPLSIAMTMDEAREMARNLMYSPSEVTD